MVAFMRLQSESCLAWSGMGDLRAALVVVCSLGLRSPARVSLVWANLVHGGAVRLFVKALQ